MKIKKLNKLEKVIAEETKGMTEAQLKEYFFKVADYFMSEIYTLKLVKKYKK